METFEVIVSHEAKRQMGECVLFLAEKDLDAAQVLRERLVNSICSLSSMPGRFPFFNEAYMPWNKYHKMFVEKYYLILYQIRDQIVYVEYVLDCRRDYRWLMH